MKLVKLSIVALSLGTCVASCNDGSGSENPKQDSIAVTALPVPPANYPGVVFLTESARETYSADTAAANARAADKTKPVDKKSKK